MYFEKTNLGEFRKIVRNICIIHLFLVMFSSRIGERILLYTKDLSHDGQTRLIPIMMATFIND